MSIINNSSLRSGDNLIKDVQVTYAAEEEKEEGESQINTERVNLFGKMNGK